MNRKKPLRVQITSKPQKRHTGWIVTAVLAGVLVLALVVLPGIQIPVQTNNTALVSFSSYAQAETYVKKRQKLMSGLTRSGCGLSLSGCGSSKQYNVAPGAGDHSQTNTQVEGVDEADVVKTDGRRIYSLAATRTKGAGAAVNVIETATDETFALALGDCVPQGMYLTGNRLAVIATVYETQTFGRAFTRVTVYDVAPALPATLAEFTYPAGYVTSRRVDNSLYLAMRDGNVLDDGKLVIPSARINGRTIKAAPEDIFGAPGPGYENGFVYFAVVDLNDGVQTDLKAYYGTFDNLYMNGSAVYTAASDYSYRRGVYGYNRGNATGTIVNRFTADPDRTAFHSTATVPGTVLNQFSMDEYEGYFRIATTLSDGGARLTVLGVGENALTETSYVDGMGYEDGEHVYSVRFEGDICYLVTARQTDPLYLVDLTDPACPAVKSELKIPDVSDYMHMYDDDTVIGIGRQEQGGAFYGLQVTLFDVSDRSAPVKRDQYRFHTDTYSEITNDHRALLYYTLPDGQTVFGFPITSSVSGFALLTTDGSTLTYAGSLVAGSSKSDDPFAYEKGAEITRAVAVGSSVYALSADCFVTAQIESVGTPTLTETRTVYFRE